MANLVFHVSGHCYGLGYLITQELPVTLTQSMECLLHRVFRYSQLRRYIRLGPPTGFIGEKFLQAIE
jgi:hypothetical protein